MSRNGGFDEGWDMISAKLSAISQMFPRETDHILLEMARKIIKDAQDNYVPVDTGALKASGFARIDDAGGVELGFGGEGIDYALVVHENPAPYHPIGQWKYLEEPVTAAMPGMLDNIAEVLFMHTAKIARQYS